MLPRHNRIVEPGDFRRVVRRGDKCVTEHMICYRSAADTNRVGIVVTSKCGNAVVRNTVRRRVRAISRELVDSGALTGDVVFRFRCEGPVPTYAQIEHEIRECVTRWAARS